MNKTEIVLGVYGDKKFTEYLSMLLQTCICCNYSGFSVRPISGIKEIYSDYDEVLLIIQEDAISEIDTCGISENNVCIARTGKLIDEKIAPDMPYFRMNIEPMITSSEIWLKFINQIRLSKDKINDMGVKYGTDKASVQLLKDKIIFGHDYLRHYEKIFSPIRNEKIKICEYGCGKGYSLKLWKEYFKKGNVVGVDVNECASNYSESRIDVIIGNATDIDVQRKLKNTYSEFEIFIDDASHSWGDIRVTLENSWELLAHEGIYILEDICCGSFWAYLDKKPTVYDSQHIFDYVLDRCDILRMPVDWNPMYNAKYFEQLPYITRKIESELDEVLIYPGTCVFRKR